MIKGIKQTFLTLTLEKNNYLVLTHRTKEKNHKKKTCKQEKTTRIKVVKCHFNVNTSNIEYSQSY